MVILHTSSNFWWHYFIFLATLVRSFLRTLRFLKYLRIKYELSLKGFWWIFQISQRTKILAPIMIKIGFVMSDLRIRSWVCRFRIISSIFGLEWVSKHMPCHVEYDKSMIEKISSKLYYISRPYQFPPQICVVKLFE